MRAVNLLADDSDLSRMFSGGVFKRPTGSPLSSSTRFSESRFQLEDRAQRPSLAGSDKQPPPPPSGSSHLSASSQMGQHNSRPGRPYTATPAAFHDVAHSSRSSTQGSFSAQRMTSRNTSTPSKSSSAPGPRTGSHHDLRTPHSKEWSMDKIEASLFNLTKELDRNHAKLVHYSLRTATQQKPPERRHLSATADLADLKAPAASADSEERDENIMKVALKVHKDDKTARVNAGRKAVLYEVTCIKTGQERVPRYRVHHIELSHNVLSPNTSLKFIPHLRDMQEHEVTLYNRWIAELQAMDTLSGFKDQPFNRDEKASKMLHEETAIEVSLYIDRWIQKLGLDDCSKSSLVRYMAGRSENNDRMTPRQKSNIINMLSDDVASPRAIKAAKMFTDAFNNLWRHTGLSLKDVLVHDEAVEAVTENKKLVKDSKADTEQQGAEQLLNAVESNLLTYTILGCLFCYAHSCEHGDHDRDNRRRPIGVELIGNFGGLIRPKLADVLSGEPQDKPMTACRNECWIRYQDGNAYFPTKPWTEDEILLLKGLYIALGATNLHLPCLASALLGRHCWDVYRKKLQLELDDRPLRQLAEARPSSPNKVKAVPWYDRFRKELKQDWQEQLHVHDFTRREVRDPCNHDGSCGKSCPCVIAKLLCDRFCRCTCETCAYKYTGCACGAIGKTCLQQKVAGRPCICVQLNRECDPVLCSGCGAHERADPVNAHDKILHATGCQNVALQRGVSKSVLLGESQIEDCGYGLFAAEDIGQDEFIIEYVGELISHDEGVRREARRGDVFDESSHSSYLFTLLDYEGIWVDAAIYGNLSRYINHGSASEEKAGGKRDNIIPQILFVNGDFRIKFRALRDIKAGEELFFNYGENFGNLTKKLLDANSSETETKRGGNGGRGGRGGRGRGGRGRGRGGAKVSAETKKTPRVVANEADDEFPSDPPVIMEQEDDDDDFDPSRRLKAKRAGAMVGNRGGRKRKLNPVVNDTSAEPETNGNPRPRGQATVGPVAAYDAGKQTTRLTLRRKSRFRTPVAVS
ncbi:hypothetical protein BD289DRAFT_180136 [Coniella lustricola]|uniref:SET domain-containing protein n=1 Tax=Coniella lustricola TaxID=2025994 RepID=A0A2T2ZTG9_9PEZI|nr:hypothetical protein BD289DRAFT_180136 [Coniella lustricola]